MSKLDMELLRQQIAVKLCELEPLFQPFMRLTFVARDPKNPDCIIVVTNDDAAGVAAGLKRQAEAEA